MGSWFGKGWAMPVTSRKWAFAATVTEWGKRLTRYHAFVLMHHRCWEHAVGVK